MSQLFIIETFTEAVSSQQLKRATELASSMNDFAKGVCREIWLRWVNDDCPF